MNLRVHCLLDCLSYTFQRGDHREHRPLYFGVWDTPFGTNSEGKLVYLTEDLLPNMLKMIKELYGDCGRYLDDIHHCKEQAELLPHNGNYLITQVDLFYLPYPNKCYKVKHRPHFIVINNYVDDHFLISDPYFSWYGQVTEKEFYDALVKNNPSFCFLLQKESVQHPSIQQIASSFQKQMNLQENTLYMAVNALVARALVEDLSMEDLSYSLNEIGVMVDQKNGFSHVLSYFSEVLSLDVHKQEVLLRQFIEAWKKVSMLVIRIGITKKMEDLQRLSDILKDINVQELLLKMEVWNLFVKCKQKFLVRSSTI